MSVLVISNLSLRIVGRPLFEEASLTIENGQKVGLVGRNGAGKSTLLAAIAGDIPVDGGTILLPSRIRMARVKQESPSGNLSLLDTVLAADQERTELLHQSETSQDAYYLGEIHERLKAIGADSAPARAASILAGLGFDTTAQQRPVSDFSGGWRMRVALASTLFLNPDLLLLDEPTNHLDLEATLWLESWLANFPGSALIVSHDRNLLDHTVDAIVHLNQRKLSLTPGGYEEFIRIRNGKALQQNREAERIAAKRAHMQAFVDRFRAKATKARQAQARLKALEKLPPLQSIIEEHPIQFEFPQPAPLPPPLITLSQVKAGYGDQIILSNLSLRIDPEDRIALLGANGNGKSTFIKIIAGRLNPLEGSLQNHPKLSVGYFAQHQLEELIPEETPLNHMAKALPKASATELRAQLARFGLDADRVETPVNALSGGEKARLVLTLATRHNPHILLLDEPTNHLDLDAREALVHALSSFEGAVILISHDPRLVELVADRLWLVNEGRITPFDGTIRDYQEWLENRRRESIRQEKSLISSVLSAKDIRKERADKRKALQPLRKKAKNAEFTIEKLTLVCQKLEGLLGDSDFYQSSTSEEVTATHKKLAELKKQQSIVEEEWLMLQSMIEAEEID